VVGKITADIVIRDQRLRGVRKRSRLGKGDGAAEVTRKKMNLGERTRGLGKEYTRSEEERVYEQH